MRIGVLDVGSNAVKLHVFDAGPGRAPLPVHSFKQPLKLLERGPRHGQIGERQLNKLIDAIASATSVAGQHEVEEIVCFATQALREAPNQDVVCRRIHSRTGVDVQVLSGTEEARLGYFAARRWYGWSAGSLLYVELGGGSLQIAFGHHEEPDFADSFELGAAAVTREFLRHDPPDPNSVRALRKHVRNSLDELSERLHL